MTAFALPELPSLPGLGQPAPARRRTPGLPQVPGLGSPLGLPPSLYPDGDTTPQINAATTDIAIAANRAQTSQAALDQREQPRLSISEMNALDIDDIRRRYERIRKRNDRGPVQTFLDLIDLPRNAVANAISSTVMPEARRRAVERGDVDDAGLPKVYASDLLRGLGIENRIITGAGGFLLDIVTDPLTWIGGPIGGVKAAGVQGGRVALGRTGQKVLRSAAKKLNTHGVEAITDAAAQRLFRSTAESLGHDLTTQAGRRATTDAVLGAVSPIRNAAGAVGVSQQGGSLLADDLYRVVDNAATPAEAARIRSVKDFVGQYTLNRGLQIGQNANFAAAHVPFTDLTLYTPGFSGFGRAAAFQRAAAKAVSGKPILAGSIVGLSNDAEGLARIAREMQSEADRARSLDALSADGDLWSAYNAQQSRFRLADLDRESEQAIEAFRAGAAARADALKELNLDDVTDVADLLATAEDARKARAALGAIEQERRWRDAEQLIARPTPGEIDAMRSRRLAAQNIAAADTGITADEIATLADPAAPRSERALAYENAVSAMLAKSNDRMAALAELADTDLNAADRVASGFSRALEAYDRLADASRAPLLQLLNGPKRDLYRSASAMLLGIDEGNIGAMPLMSVRRAFEKVNASEEMPAVQAVQGTLAKAFGIRSGMLSEQLANIRQAATSAGDAGAELFQQIDRGGAAIRLGIRDIAQKHGIGREQIPLLRQAAAALAEQRSLGRVAEKATISGTAAGAAGRFLEKLPEWRSRPELWADLNNLADDASGLLRSYLDDSLARGTLNEGMSQYLPLAARPQAVERIRRLDPSSAPVASAIQRASSHSKTRSTYLIRFTDDAGQAREFSVMEAEAFRNLDAETLGNIARNNPDAAEYVREMQDNLAAFEAKYGAMDLDEAARLMGRAMGPFELNARYAEGAFQGLVGGELTDTRLFETDLGALLAMRASADRIEDAQDAFTNAITPFGLRFDPAALRQTGGMDTYREVVLPNGVRAMVLPSEKGSDALRVRIGDRVYRTVDSRPGAAIDPTYASAFDAQLSNLLLPETLAEQVDRWRSVATPDNANLILQAVDRFTGLFRSTTLIHPSWIIGNLIGNAWLSMAAKPDAWLNGRMERRIGQVVRALGAQLRGRELGTISIGGREVPMRDLLDLAVSNRIANGGHSAEAARHVLHSEGLRRPVEEAATPRPGFRGAMQDRYDRAMGERMAALQRLKDPSPLSKNYARFRAASAAVKSGLFDGAVRSWFKLGGSVDDAFRIAMFAEYLDDGMNAAGAAEATKRALLNFGDLTDFERSTLRPLIPFYSWLKASLPAMMRQMIARPADLAAVPKVQEALEELLVGEAQVPIHQRPRWMQDAVAIQLTANPESRTSFLLGTLIPQEQVLRVVPSLAGVAASAFAAPVGGRIPGVPFDGSDLVGLADWGAGQLSPPVKSLFDLAAGRESFSGRTIGGSADEADLSVSDYALGYIRWLRESGLGISGEGPLSKAASEGVGSVAGRLAVGGRLQPGLSEPSRLGSLRRELRDREEQLRKVINRAERDGDSERSANARANLLATYAEHLRRGGDPADIPAWARRQLQELAQPALAS